MRRRWLSTLRKPKQKGLGGEVFHHRGDARTEGWINGHPVIVATAERLRELRQGYEPRDVDLHDLAILDALGGSR